MTIERNLRELLSEPSASNAPDPDPWLARKIFTQWLADKEANEEPHVRSSTAPFWASDGATCARKLSYSLLERAGLAEKSNPPTVADIWRFYLGNLVHDAMQGAMPDDDHEVRAVLVDDDGVDLVSCRADSVIDLFENGGGPPIGKAAVEMKSINGFGFKTTTTTFKGPPEGPRFSHVVQLALTVKALNQAGEHGEITHGVLLYASLENLSPKTRDLVDTDISRFAAQWTYTREELDVIADEVITRLLNIRRVVSEGDLAPRVLYDPEIPRGAKVVEPLSGAWELRNRDDELVRYGNTWMCGYCDFRDQCLEDGA